MSHGRIVDSAFRPHPLLRNAHLQTILGSLARPLPRLPLKRERLELPDGDFVDLGFTDGPSLEHGRRSDGPLALLIHGLSGGFDSKYLRGTARQLMQRGFRCVLFQQRGAGDEPNRLPQNYHHGASHDLGEVLKELRRREPRTPLLAVGWSLGGNVLLKHLGEEGARSPLTAAVAVSAPFLLHECALVLRRGFPRVYQNAMMRELKAGLRRKFERVALPKGFDLGPALRARDFIEFDEAYTAPLNGFADALDYYARSANRQFLRHIRRPTLILHAKDDPFMTPAIIPEASELSTDVTLELSRHGGHVGFIAADGRGRPYPWAEPHIADHLADAAGLASREDTAREAAPA